jgi:HEPN domain-containing protein
MDEAKRDEVGQWLLKAQRDLGAAYLLKASDASYLDIVVYHCQQSAEKALKTYLTHHDAIFPKTHDIRVLLGLCVSLDSAFSQFEEIAENLTPYAVVFRYPANEFEPDEAQAEQAIEMADILLKFVISVLPTEFGSP